MKKVFSISWLIYCSLYISNHEALQIPSDMPVEHRNEMQEQYELFLKSREGQKDSAEKFSKQVEQPVSDWKSPRQLGMSRNIYVQDLIASGLDTYSIVNITMQEVIPTGTYWFGTQMGIGPPETNGKIVPVERKDGADLRKRVKITQPFTIDIHTVTARQFSFFVDATGYKTEAEIIGWSFVLDRFKFFIMSKGTFCLIC